MKTVQKLVISAIAIPALLGSVSAFAGGCGPMNGGGGHGSDFHGMMRVLDLTTEQRDEIRDIQHDAKNEMYNEMKANRDEMRSIHEQQQALVLAKTFDEKKAESLAKKMVTERIQHRVEMMKWHNKMFNVLTPEQQEKWTEFVKNRGDNFGCFDGQNHRGMKGDRRGHANFGDDGQRMYRNKSN